jgi:branched-subunit amino acid aminotransferase/4-amino-4-deoxychorismate lyase
MSGAVYVNGRITPEDQAVVPVFDHGFLYGEGVYEVCRTYRGRPFLLDRHLHRLRTSAGLIALTVPHSDGELETRIGDTMAAAGLFPWHRRPDA